MYRAKINTFCSDESRNVFEFELKSMQSDTILMSIFHDDLFAIRILKSGEFEVEAQTNNLQGQWEENVNSFLQTSGTKDVGELLDYASTEFSNLPDGDLGDDLSISNDMLSEDGGGGDIDDVDIFESIIDEESTLKKNKHEKIIAAAHEKKVIEAKAKAHLDNIFESAKEIGLIAKDITNPSTVADAFNADPDVLQLYIHFFFDGFTIGKSIDMKESLELRSMDDPLQKPILESLKAGFVPREFSGHYKEVDVHMIYKQCNFDDRFKEEVSSDSNGQPTNETNDNNVEDDSEKVTLDGFGEFTLEEIEQQRLMLEAFSQMNQPNQSDWNTQQTEDFGEGSSLMGDMDDDLLTGSCNFKSQSSEMDSPSLVHQPQQSIQTSQQSIQTPQQPKSDFVFVRDKNFTYEINPDEPITGLRIFLESELDRSTFNISTTIETLYQYSAHRFDLNDNFLLSYGGKPLKDLQKTLKELGLRSATIRIMKSK